MDTDDLSRFRFTVDLDPAGAFNAVHLDAIGIAGLIHRARGAYLTDGVGFDWAGMRAIGGNIPMRRVEVDYRSEVFEAVMLRAGVRAVSRGRTSFVFEEALWIPGDGDRLVATGRSVHVAVRAGLGAVPIPDDFWERVEAFEGRTIPPG